MKRNDVCLAIELWLVPCNYYSKQLNVASDLSLVVIFRPEKSVALAEGDW